MLFRSKMKQVQDIWLSPLDLARPYAMPPETPPERVEAVKRAFYTMIKDADFLADAKKTGMVVDPRPAEDILALLRRIGAMPREVIEEAKKAAPG